MLQRAVCPDIIAAEREMHVVALQRIEARIRIAVGDRKRAGHAEVAVMDHPFAGRVAEHQRDVADR
jgi:hypothetical protein